MTIIVAHYISLLIYSCVILGAIRDLYMIRNCQEIPRLKPVLVVFLCVTMLQAVTLIFLQLDWLIGNAGREVYHSSSVAWLAFDLFSGIAALTYVTAINIYLSWKNPESPENPRLRRRRSDP